MITITGTQDAHAFRSLIIERCGEDTGKCIQCGKCSAGCPIAPDMDYLPNQVMELIRLNQKERLLTASSYWFCASCQTCSIRCPYAIDIALVMNTLRKLTLEGGYAPAEKRMPLFNRIFLDSIHKYGRVYELGMVSRFNLASGQPFKDALLGAAMMAKRKIALLPHRIRRLDDIKSIFAKYKKYT